VLTAVTFGLAAGAGAGAIAAGCSLHEDTNITNPINRNALNHFMAVVSLPDSAGRSKRCFAELRGLRPVLGLALLASFAKPCLIPFEMPGQTSPTQSAEDYLERIHELIEAKGYARVVDIASSLKVRQASVTSMVQKLGRAGFVKYEKYRGLILTDKGREVARSIQSRHAALTRFFSLFGLDAETQRADIEGIEHHLSPATLQMLTDLAGFFEQNPGALREFKQSRKRDRKP
jgi:Mn-dependent DtxR family transcriptional regulator